ncbi:methylmalonyl-CoA epimerase, mitochondrial isoform X2 [Rhinatrema bivittatum]|uniref:methylmalonyl-CoA epimerase, mitochondrial isoform X2 n=1 Tax=Rhinatrema bivittatum TaxID=194408 RepID=UPI00112976B6|nr:methylmalonyl-CoA epimerase, mitochondrial isoform X2 [Rhinatrema bivittatum]
MAASIVRGAGLFTRLQTAIPAVRALSASQSMRQNVPGSLWKLGSLNHIAIAVPDLEKARSFYQDVLGARVSKTVLLPEHGVYTVFVDLGNTKLELLHPLGKNSPVAGFLERNKAGGMHHICVEKNIRKMENFIIERNKENKTSEIQARLRVTSHHIPFTPLNNRFKQG